MGCSETILNLEKGLPCMQLQSFTDLLEKSDIMEKLNLKNLQQPIVVP